MRLSLLTILLCVLAQCVGAKPFSDDTVAVRLGNSVIGLTEARRLTGSSDVSSPENRRLLSGYLARLESARAARYDTLPALEGASGAVASDLMVALITADSIEAKMADGTAVERFFAVHRDRYRWDAPHYKGLLVVAVDSASADSAAAIADRMGRLPGVDAEIRTELMKVFGPRVKMVRVCVAKGENPYVDHAVFGSAFPENEERWRAAVAIGGRIIMQPEEVADMRGEVEADVRKYLTDEWIDRLLGSVAE